VSPAVKTVRANQALACSVGKREYFVQVGELLPANHPVVKAHPSFFGTLDKPGGSRVKEATTK
jgi:hypothetical protein